MIYLGVPVTVVVVGLLLMAFLRVRTRQSTYSSTLNDEHLRRIVDDGFLVYEDAEPLDLEEINQAERDFWTEERWDESEEW